MLLQMVTTFFSYKLSTYLTADEWIEKAEKDKLDASLGLGTGLGLGVGLGGAGVGLGLGTEGLVPDSTAGQYWSVTEPLQAEPEPEPIRCRWSAIICR